MLPRSGIGRALLLRSEATMFMHLPPLMEHHNVLYVTFRKEAI